MKLTLIFLRLSIFALLTSYLFLSPQTISATSTTFLSTYGSNGTYEPTGIIGTSDGGSLVTGWTTTEGNGGHDGLIYKLDPTGNLQWSRLIGGTGDDRLHKVVELTDGSIVTVGITLSFGAGNTRILLTKLDSNGNIIWTKKVSSSIWELGFEIKESPDGNIVISGSRRMSDNYDHLLSKFDTNGNLLWSKTFGISNGSLSDTAYSFDFTDDGGYILAGITERSLGNPNASIIKIDSNLNVSWQKRLASTTGINNVSQIQQLPDGSFVLAGTTGNYGAGSNDGYLMKISSDGDTLWLQTFGSQSEEHSGRFITTPQGDYVTVGMTRGFGSQARDAFITKISSNGDWLWSRAYGMPNRDEWAGAIGLATDNGILVAASDYGQKDIVVLKLNQDGDINACSDIRPITPTLNRYYPTLEVLTSRSSNLSLSLSNIQLANLSSVLNHQQVCQANQPPVAKAGTNITANEGELVNLNGSASFDPDPWDTIVSYHWDLGDQATASGQTPSHTYRQDGSYEATLTVTDSLGLTDDDKTTITVNNLAPVITQLTATPEFVAVSEPLSFSGQFTDKGILDTHTAIWNWGDGQTFPGSLTDNGGSGSVNDTHSFSQAGIYTVTLTVSDEIDQSDPVEVTVVVFDPQAGFVTGGGQVEDPNLTNHITFGFNIKYKPNSTTPTGHLNMIHDNYHLTSDAFNWLVVSGNQASFTGDAQINNQTGFTFTINLTDNGQSDSIHIQVYNPDQSILFQTSGPQPLDKGNLKIH